MNDSICIAGHATFGRTKTSRFSLKLLGSLFLLSILPLMTLSAKPIATALVADSKPLAKIYVDPSDLAVVTEGKKAAPPSPLALAIEDLNYHFNKMSGATLEVVETSNPKDIKSPALVLGSLASKVGATPPQTKWKEGYRIRVDNKSVAIAGENPRATSYGIYDFLNSLGIDWVMPGTLGEIIPERKTISVAVEDRTSSPDFGMRRFWYRGGPNIVSKEARSDYDQWTRRQRLGMAEEFQKDREGHAWEAIFNKYKDAFKEDPDMLALVRLPDGTLVRKGPQLESTNPKVIDLIVDDIKETFEKAGWPKDKAVTLSISPADGGGYSVSPESQAAGSGRMDPMIGSPDETDLVIKLANDVLEKIGKEYPHLSLGYYIYSVHEGYPVRYTPNPRIYPILAPISYSRFHSTEDPHSKSRAYYNHILKQWAEVASEQGNRLSVYEYNWNLADNMLPFTRLKMLSEDIQYYHRLGLAGFILESTKAWSINGPADYVAAKLVWDASQDWKKLFKDYSEKSFGPAAPMMESYYDRLAQRQSEAGQEAGSYYAAPLIFDDAYMVAAQADIDKALAQNLTPAQRERTEAAAYPLSALKNYLAWNKAMAAFDFETAKKELDTLLENWQKMLDKNVQFVAQEVPGYTKGLMRASTEEALKYSSAPYQIIFRLPEALPTALDPEGEGALMNMAGTEINDSGWLKTQTYGSTWDAQGLGFYRSGAIWYRVHFEVSKELEGKAIGLFLGGFEDEAKVWINGQSVGSSGIKFANPAVFDLTDHITYGKDNILAIQIVRNSTLNEIFVGGIFRPSFVFTGPRVEVSTKRGDPEYRVLPGGEKAEVK